eukprot:gene26284-biopygen15550
MGGDGVKGRHQGDPVSVAGWSRDRDLSPVAYRDL